MLAARHTEAHPARPLARPHAPRPPCRSDVLVVCGDVSDELAALETALATLASKFGHVFYVPGTRGAGAGSGVSHGVLQPAAAALAEMR